MEKTKTYSECVEVREPLSDVQFLYGKIEQLVKENEELQDKIREQNEEILERRQINYAYEKRCDYAYAFCYELQHLIACIANDLRTGTKKNATDRIEAYGKEWVHLTDKYNDEFTKYYNVRKKVIKL